MKRFSLALAVMFVATLFAQGAIACDMHAKAKNVEKHAEHGAKCAHADGKSCPMKDRKIAEKKDVTMTGKLLCMHCNLNKEEKCRKVFQSADNAEKLYDLCPGANVDLEKIAEEGSATVTIKGKLVKAEDGTEMLMIESAEKVAAPAA